VFAAHFAAALAIKTREPKAPATVLLIGAFVPDIIWVVLALTGVEPAATATFFDDWSHSLLMVVLWAVLYAACFVRSRGWPVAIAAGAAVLSHFFLDLPIHPKPLGLYPYSHVRLSVGLASVAPLSYWYVQLVVVLALLAVYVWQGARIRVPRSRLTQTCIFVLALHLLLAP
jgi:hypothetical protein